MQEPRHEGAPEEVSIPQAPLKEPIRLERTPLRLPVQEGEVVIVQTEEPRGARQEPAFSHEELGQYLQLAETEKPQKKAAASTRLRFSSLVVLTRQLAVMLAAGVSLRRIFHVLSKESDDRNLKRVLNGMVGALEGGKSMSAAMKLYPRAFSATYVAMVEAAEASGTVPDTMYKLATLLEKEMTLLRKVRAAMTYPVVVVVFAVATFCLLMTYIFPIFFQFYKDLNVPLPLVTRILIFAFELPRNPIFLISLALLAILGWLWFRGISSQPKCRLFIDRHKLRIPIFGPLHRKVVMARLCRIFGTMIMSGVPLLSALEILRKATGNAYFSLAVHAMTGKVRGGLLISQCLREALVFPPMVVNMARVGEESGNLDEMFVKMADFYDVEIDYLLSNLASVLEPFLIAGLGVVVGTIIVGLFLPLYGVLSLLK